MELRLDIPGVSGDTEKDIKNLNNYVFQLTEQLRYLLNNLDVTNFNDLGLMRYENGRLQIYSDKLTAAVHEMEWKLNDPETGMGAMIVASAQALRVEFSETYLKTDEFQSKFDLSAKGLKLENYLTKEEAGETYVASSTFDVTEGRVSGIVENIGEDGTVTAASIAAKLQGEETLIQMIASKVDVSGFVSTSVFEQTADKVSAIVTAIGDEDEKVTVASIAARIKDDKSLIELIAGEVDVDGVTKFTNISEGENQTIIDGAMIRSEGEWSFQYTEIDGGKIKLGDMGSISVADQGFVRMVAGNLRLDSDGDIVIAAHSASNGAVYIYPCSQYASGESRYGWRFKPKTIDHWDPTVGGWVTVVQG